MEGGGKEEKRGSVSLPRLVLNHPHEKKGSKKKKKNARHAFILAISLQKLWRFRGCVMQRADLCFERVEVHNLCHLSSFFSLLSFPSFTHYMKTCSHSNVCSLCRHYYTRRKTLFDFHICAFARVINRVPGRLLSLALGSVGRAASNPCNCM